MVAATPPVAPSKTPNVNSDLGFQIATFVVFVGAMGIILYVYLRGDKEFRNVVKNVSDSFVNSTPNGKAEVADITETVENLTPSTGAESLG